MSRTSTAHALLVAISAYEVAEPLPQAVINDAEDLASLLRSPAHCGYPDENVRRLENKSATKSAIINELDRLARTAGPADTVCILFSGHGWKVDGQPSSLLPVEATLDDLEGTTISAHDLSERLDAIPAARLVVLLDACHAGAAGFLKDAFGGQKLNLGINAGLIERLADGTGRAIIASSTPEERSLVMPGARNSAFTQALLEGLRGAADLHSGGTIRLFSLFDYVAERVPALTGDKQHPVLRTRLERNFPIAVAAAREKGAAAAVSPAGNERLRAKLLVIMSRLYAGGPVEADIWERAGGDLSQLNLNKAGRSVWFQALKLLEQGGGGAVTAAALIREALADFPANRDLLSLS